MQEESDASAKRSGAAMYPVFKCNHFGRWSRCDPLIESQPKTRVLSSRGTLRAFPIDGLDRFASMSSSALQFMDARTQPHPSIAELLVRLPRVGAPGRSRPWPATSNDPRHLVGQCDRDALERSPSEKLSDLGYLSGCRRARRRTAWAPIMRSARVIGRPVSRSARASVCLRIDSGDRGQGFRLNATMQSDRRRPPVPTKAAGVSLPAWSWVRFSWWRQDWRAAHDLSYRQILVTAGPVRRRRLWADGQSVWR